VNKKLKSVRLDGEFVSEFVNLLRYVHDKYEKSEDGSRKREWLAMALGLISRMVREIHPEIDREDLVSPVTKLIDSLSCLDYSTIDPALRPPKLTYRPIDPRWALFRGYAAAASALLIRDGATASMADACVARLLSGEGCQKPGGSGDTRITAATIKGWRKEAREREPGDLLRTAFRNAVEGEDSIWGEEFLRELTATYPDTLFEDGIEKRAANAGYIAPRRCWKVIALILDGFPQFRLPEK
jgi:hypothetical protein